MLCTAAHVSGRSVEMWAHINPPLPKSGRSWAALLSQTMAWAICQLRPRHATQSYPVFRAGQSAQLSSFATQADKDLE
jgi:hypothetical protein